MGPELMEPSMLGRREPQVLKVLPVIMERLKLFEERQEPIQFVLATFTSLLSKC